MLSGTLYICGCHRCFIAEDFVTDDRKQQTSQRASLIALGVVVVLFVLGWFLTREIYSNQKIEDCVLSGRTNCVPIDTPSSY
jgi:hypothetical protein